MTLYRVEVEERRTWIIYVDSEGSSIAEDAAIELADGFDADDYEVEAYSVRVLDSMTITDTEDVWVGGPEGQFITYGEYKMTKR